MFTKCAYCRKCEGAAFQSIPHFMCGNKFGKYLIVAQNPGEMSKDPSRMFFSKLLNEYVASHKENELGPESEEFFKMWYEWDFGTSYGATKFAEIFGKDWLQSGDFCYTNAVRCRTPNNAYPSEEMIVNCKVFAKQLLYGRDLVILVGKLAASQILSLEKIGIGQKFIPKVGYTPAVFVKDEKVGKCLLIPHYARVGDYTAYKTAFEMALEAKTYAGI